MKQKIVQTQKQSLILTHSLQNQIKLLALSGKEMRTHLLKLIDVLFKTEEEDKVLKFFRDQIFIDNYLDFLKAQQINYSEYKEPIKQKNLRDSLLEQFILLSLKDYEYLIGEYLIDSISDDGRLDSDIDYEDIKLLIYEKFKISIDANDINIVLKKIQKLEPVGCGFMDILESFDIQIEELEINQKRKNEIKETLRNISEGKIALKGISSKDKKIIGLLNFDLGKDISFVDDIYIKPDVLVTKDNGNWFVALNDSFMQKNLLDKIKDKVNESKSEIKINAKSLLNGLEKRQMTLLSVSDYLVKLQSGFLEGRSRLAPITLREISISLKLNESTISRIVNYKYLQLPSKTIKLRSLMEKKVNRKIEGRNITPSQLLDLIKEVISDEDKSNPLSDEKIRLMLSAKYFIEISRRTISKYREKANLGSARLRRKSIIT